MVWHMMSCLPAVIPARQPQLLDPTGNINSQLLARGGNPLVLTSLVLKTKLGSFIQVGVREGRQAEGHCTRTETA